MHPKTTPKLKESTVLVIGSTGHGKSTFLSYVFGKRFDSDGSKEVFSVGRAHQSHTKILQARSITYEGTKITFIDTPGLNEASSERDIQNMYGLIMCLVERFRYINCIILCNLSKRLDGQNLDTLCYYVKIFRELFSRGQVITLRTDFSCGDFDANETTEYRRAVRAMLNDPMVISKVGDAQLVENISFCDVINSRWSKRFVKRSFLKKGFNLPKSKDDMEIEHYSEFLLRKIFKYVSNSKSCKPLDVGRSRMALPPFLETKRKFSVNQVKKLMDQEVATMKLTNRQCAYAVETTNRMSSLLRECEQMIEKLKSNLDLMEKPIIKSKKTVAGMVWLKFFDKKLKLKCPRELLSFTPRVMNDGGFRCRMGDPKFKETSIEVKIMFEHILYFDKETNQGGNSYSIDIWLEYDGKEVNGRLINEKQKDLTLWIGKRNEIKKDLKLKQHEHREILKMLEKCEKSSETYNRILKVLECPEFNLKTVPLVVQMIERQCGKPSDENHEIKPLIPSIRLDIDTKEVFNMNNFSLTKLHKDYFQKMNGTKKNDGNDYASMLDQLL